ncbi:MAG: hypothetical protein GW938_07540 [Leptospira sp.]|nr:hypothetical protein [Leptospira sp.]
MPSFLGPYSLDEFPEDNLLKKINIVKITIDSSSNPGTYNLGDILQAGTQILQFFIKIRNPFENSEPSLTIGTNSEPIKFADSSESVDFSTQGIFVGMSFETLEFASQIKCYWNPNGAINGEMDVYALLSDP